MYEKVYLKYIENDDNFILKNLNFSINPKEKIAIVGKSGSGKSTIIQALFRIIDIEETSNIFIDDLNFR